jgi:hypothetical protein
MKKTVALLAGCILAMGHEEARAVTFTPDMWVYEVNLTPEINILEEIGGLEQFELSSPGRIGFNSSAIVCAGSILFGCPVNGEEFSANGNIFYNVALFDASRGELSYCGGASDGAGFACYSLSPENVAASSLRNIGGRSGTWDFGFGGFWQTKDYDDLYLDYSGTGTLVGSPVPLPAPAFMLGSALAAFGAFGIHGARRRHKP